LIKKFGSLPEAWNYFKNPKLCRGALQCASTGLASKIEKFSLEELESDLIKHQIGIITLDSPEYPGKLRQIKHPPLVLYYKCRDALQCVSNTESVLAVVGTRHFTAYGKQALNHILPGIISRKVTIVSGLARGIDIRAHEITLKQKGRAIAVLAGGLDEIYPPEHKFFAQEIIDSGGLLVSEHPPGTQYLKQYFPARNRIISGLSDAVLVVEAKEKSGALITTSFAFSQGRKVLAVPGSILSSQSRGVNSLFQKNAIPVQQSEDVLAALFGRKRNKFCGSAAKQRLSFCQEGINLTTEESRILKNILLDNPIPLNIIIRKTGLPAARAISTVTQLEIKGVIELADGGYIKLLN